MRRIPPLLTTFWLLVPISFLGEARAATPAIPSVAYPVIAHGDRLISTGPGLGRVPAPALH
jgi:hypothetical protein